MSLLPLSGVRIVEAGSSHVVSYGARLLASLGAEVVRIEEASSVSSKGGIAEALNVYLNGQKHRVGLDLSSARGQELLVKLLCRADIFLHDTHVPGVPADLAASCPTLHVVSVSAFNDVNRAANSDMIVQHASGLAWHQAAPVNSPESQPPIAGADLEGPLAAAVAMAGAAVSLIANGDKQVKGEHIRFSLSDFYSHLLVEPVADWVAGDRTFARKGLEGRGPEIAGGLIWLLQCADGWVVISPREQHQWDRWIELIDTPDWSGDADLCGDGASRSRNALRLQALMSDWSRQRSKTDIFGMAQGARVPCFPINTPDDLLANEQLAARRFFDHAVLPDGRAIRIPGLPFHMVSADGKCLEQERTIRIGAIADAETVLGARSVDEMQREGALAL